MRRARSRRAAALAILVTGAAAASLGGARRAQAEAILQLVPSLGVGASSRVTQNQMGTYDRLRDVFGLVTFSALGRDELPRSTHTLSYVFAYSKFLQHSQDDTLSNALVWASTLNPSARFTLALGANVAQSRTARVGVYDPTTVTPQGSASGSISYLSLGANERLMYEPDGRRRITQSLSAVQLRLLDTPATPPNTFVAFEARGEQLTGRNLYAVELQVGDSYSPNTTLATSFAGGNIIIAAADVLWQHELSATWSTQLRAGPIVMLKVDPAAAVVAPGGLASVIYQRRPWFATLTASQAAAPNLFLGEATLNDSVLARLALPVTRDDLVFVSGFAGYLFARVANGSGDFSRAFDQLTAGGLLTARFARLPLAATLAYTVVDQRGSGSQFGSGAPDLAYQIVTLNLSGIFAFGRGTPPLFGGTP